MIFSLDVRRARKGDCLILHYGTKANPGLALIDGGPAQVYKPHLKPRLAQIRAARGLDDSEPLPVDLLMVSHIDDDHINGILGLTRELVDAKRARRRLPFKVLCFWHNTFDDVLGNSPDELIASVKASFGPASLAGEPDIEGLDSHTAKVLASVGQGMRLRDDARNLQLRINPQFDGKLIMVQDGATIDLGRGLKFTVAGPMKLDLIALQKEHDAFLKEAEKTAKPALASFSDTSVANLSSIVVLAEAGGTRMLLTGDARGDKILQGLETVGQLPPRGKMHVDILKAPHHGSDRNIETVFFERITANHYVFSGNGEHGNPERQTLQMLLDARQDDDFLIHFTYPIDEIDAERELDWKKEQEKEKRKKAKLATQVRPNWSPKKYGLKAFFADHPNFAKRIRTVERDAPHVIDLLDKVGF
jgi:hypothetical protein